MMNLKRVSKFLSLILRHQPEVIGITLDQHGWAEVDDLLKGIRNQYPIDLTILEEIIASDQKGRYSFNDDHTKIRANQGHSLHVDVELKAAIPPKFLYHGTAQKSVAAITKKGLVGNGRLYVHLSTSIAAAIQVAKRHGKPCVYQIDCAKMVEAGYQFYLSKNKIWLIEFVPVAYLRQVKSNNIETGKS